MSTLTPRLTIGYINNEIHREWALYPWWGIIDAARQHNVNLVSFLGKLIAWPEQFEEQGNVLYDLATAERVDGLIIWKGGMFSRLTESEIEAFCARSGLPVVTIEDSLPGRPCVTYDNYQGMRMAVEHLIAVHGYRRIGFVGVLEHHSAFQERYRGYTDALTLHGLAVVPDLIQPWFPPDQISSNGLIEASMLHACLQRMIATGAEAIVGICDITTIQMMGDLQAQGVKIPNDLALVSFDDFTESGVVSPPLTSVNPDWYDLGRQAVHTLLNRLSGQTVSDLTVVPGRLSVRRSCGCMDPGVAQIAARLTPPTRSTACDRRVTAQDITHGMGRPDMAGEVERLIERFLMDVAGEGMQLFVDDLEALLQQRLLNPADVAAWHTALSILRQQALPWLSDGEAVARAETLWQQARLLIGQTAERNQAHQRFQDEKRAQQLREVGQALITTFDVRELLDILAERLPGLGIPACYLALYEDPHPYAYPDPAPEWSRLMLAYHEGGRVSLKSEGCRFPSRQLCPAEIWQNGRLVNLVAEPLYFREHQIGFVLFEPGPREGTIYETLRSTVSSALQGALLVRRVQDRSAELARQKYVLDTFMENVPDSIYFKDRASRITHANLAHARVMGVSDPAEEIGRSDFDFFPEEQARPKHEQEQEIMRTGQPILALEEPEAGGRWALTTKMPLRDEHGAIIGTFGISRDITELKHAQQALAQAYSEISVLNVQLQEENVRMGAELHVVKQLQQMILPRPQELTNIPGLDIVGYMQPADEVGGDYYDVLRHEGVLHIGIGDVTGHGLESGVIMLMTQAAIRTLIEHGETDPVKFVNTLNRLIYKNAERIGTDKNLTFALVQYQGGQFKLVGQHEELLVVRQGGQVERIETMNLGFPVGLEPEISQWVHTATITLNPGDGLVLYTDGIPEAENSAQQQYGLDRLCAVIGQHWGQSAEAIKQAVVDDVMAHIGAQKVYDDITLVVLKQI